MADILESAPRDHEEPKLVIRKASHVSVWSVWAVLEGTHSDRQSQLSRYLVQKPLNLGAKISGDARNCLGRLKDRLRRLPRLARCDYNFAQRRCDHFGALRRTPP